MLARTFYRCGIIKEWGRVTIRMMDLATDAGLPRPEIEERGDCVTVRFRRADYSADKQFGGDLTAQQNAILPLLRRSNHALALREIRTLMVQQASERRMREDLAILKASGLAEITGRGRVLAGIPRKRSCWLILANYGSFWPIGMAMHDAHLYSREITVWL